MSVFWQMEPPIERPIQYAPKQFQLADARQVSGVTRSTRTVHFSGGVGGGAEASEVPNRAWRPYLTSYRRGNLGDLPVGTHGTARHFQYTLQYGGISLALAVTNKQESHAPPALQYRTSRSIANHLIWQWQAAFHAFVHYIGFSYTPYRLSLSTCAN